MYKSSKKYLTFFLTIMLAQVAFAQFTIPDKPKVQTSVYDYASLLTAAQKSALESKLIQYSDSTSTQIVVITVETINREDIGILTPKWAHQWGIGQAKEDNGVLVLLANKERKVWIAPGYGVEHKLTAGITGELVRNVIIPEFKKGDFYGGLDKGSDAIFKVLKGTYKSKKTTKSEGSGVPRAFIIAIIFIILLIVFSKKNKDQSGNDKGKGFRNDSTGMDILTAILLSRAGRGGFGGGGFGGGSSGGGGFGGGFGGGGFSGGGAGGGW